MKSTLALLSPIELPGATIDHVVIDLTRRTTVVGWVEGEPDFASVARIVGLPVAVVREMEESDYVSILIEIQRLMAPRPKLEVAR